MIIRRYTKLLILNVWVEKCVICLNFIFNDALNINKILSHNMFSPFSYAVNINWRDLVRMYTKYINMLTLLIVDWQLHRFVMYALWISP